MRGIEHKVLHLDMHIELVTLVLEELMSHVSMYSLFCFRQLNKIIWIQLLLSPMLR